MKKLFFILITFFLILGCGSGGENPYDQDGGDSGNSYSETSDNEDFGLPDGGNSDGEPTGDPDENEPEDAEWAAGDDDGDGISNGVEGKKDADGDGTPDYLDTDSDNDGIPDSVEAPRGIPVDDDNDGTPNYLDEDSDGDGIPDAVEGTGDSDGDGIPDSLEGIGDADNDGIPNFIDDDSDGDGISDSIENGSSVPALDSDNDGTPDFLDPDSDGDGLSDKIEYEIGTDPRLADSDGDGFDDNSEFILGSDPNDAASVISEDTFYVILPYGSDPVVRPLDFQTDIKKVDVLILVDLSGSMMEEHANLKEGIKSTIIDGVRAQIPDSAFGLVKFGTMESQTYSLAQPITTDSDAVKNAVDGISDCGGSEEYHNLALWAAASGEYRYEKIKLPGSLFGSCSLGTSTESVTINPPDCSAYPGNIGGACFRNESLPIFIMASDESFADDDWCSWESGSRTTRDMAIEKMNAINAKFIGLDSGSSTSDFNYISDGTGSNNGAGTRFNFSVNADGTGFSQAIVNAVISLTNNIQIDITTNVKHVPNEYGLEDTTKFVKSVSPDSFPDVKPGQQVTFDVTFENNFYENDSYESKVFTATISVLGDGAFLDTRDVVIVVPGKDYNDQQ